MAKYILTLFFAMSLLLPCVCLQAKDIPHLNGASLTVSGQPFIILGGELGNSSASSTQYMKSVWPKLKAMHLNTVLVPVYWDLIEPTPGQFDFSLVDDVLRDARQHHIKVVLLWFGSWKNSMSTYSPSWIKRDAKRFGLAKNQEGTSQAILSPFDDDNLQADMRAYQALLSHIKDIDAEQQTVLMIQVENEIGMLPDARDYHPEANRLFAQAVPQELLSYLQKNTRKLHPKLHALWAAKGYKTNGNWTDIFGKSLATDEVFIAWHFARYTQQVAAAGKSIYPIPAYVNAALNRPGVLPGKYPSGGPLPHVLDIWKAAAPDIDLFAPDFYNPDFTYWNDEYTRLGETLFIPEIRFDANNAAKVFYAFGHYGAIGFSPFSIESTDHPEQEALGRAYAILQPLVPAISNAKEQGQLLGALLDKAHQEVKLTLGDYIFTVKHDYTLGWSADAKNDTWPESGVLIIQKDREHFWVSGTGVVVTMSHLNPTLAIGIDSIYEGHFEHTQWVRLRNLNGDENHQGRHLRIPTGEIATQELSIYPYEKH